MYGCETVWPCGERQRARPRRRARAARSGTKSSRGTRAIAASTRSSSMPRRRSCRSIQAAPASRGTARPATPKCSSTSALIPVIDAGGSPRPTVSIGTSESAGGERAVAAAADVVAAGEVGELPAGRGRDEHLAGVRVAQRRLGARAAVGTLVEQREVLVAVAARDDLAVLEEERDVDRRLARRAPRRAARGSSP